MTSSQFQGLRSLRGADISGPPHRSSDEVVTVVTAIAAGYREVSATMRQAVITLRRTAGAVRRTAPHPGRRTCYRQGAQRPAEMVRVSEAFSSSPSSDHIIAPP